MVGILRGTYVGSPKNLDLSGFTQKSQKFRSKMKKSLFSRLLSQFSKRNKTLPFWFLDFLAFVSWHNNCRQWRNPVRILATAPPTWRSHTRSEREYPNTLVARLKRDSVLQWLGKVRKMPFRIFPIDIAYDQAQDLHRCIGYKFERSPFEFFTIWASCSCPAEKTRNFVSL